jgi:hypothetical protein
VKILRPAGLPAKAADSIGDARYDGNAPPHALHQPRHHR